MTKFIVGKYYKENEAILDARMEGVSTYKCLYITPIGSAVLQHIITLKEYLINSLEYNRYTNINL